MRFLWAQFKVMPGKFIVVIVLPWILVSILKMLPILSEKIGHSFSAKHPASYVNLVCSDDELAKFLKMKVQALPLIGKIEEYAIANIQNTINKTLSDLEIDSVHSDDLKKMVGLKIFFDQKVSEKEFELIKGHLGRLTMSMGPQSAPAQGAREIIWGPFVQSQRSQTYVDYLDWAIYGVVFSLLYLVWLLNFLSVKHLLVRSIYLIERYQRRLRVYPKVMLIFISLNLFVGSRLINKNIISSDLLHMRSEFMPILFYLAFMFCTTLATLELQRPWKKA